MGNTFKELSGNTETNLEEMKKTREATIKKWDSLGFLDDLESHVKENIGQLYENHVKDAMAQLFENQGSEDTWHVYILRCGDDSLYCGITNNIEKRLEAHRSGNGAKYTRGRLPLTLEVYKVVESKSEALKLEYKVKKQPKHKKIEFLRSS